MQTHSGLGGIGDRMAGVRSKPRANGKYGAWFTDHTGKRRFFTGIRSQKDTLRMAQRLEDEHRQVRLGYRPPASGAERHGARRFADTCDDYLAWGGSQGGRGGRPWGETQAWSARRGYPLRRPDMRRKCASSICVDLPRGRQVSDSVCASAHAGSSSGPVPNRPGTTVPLKCASRVPIAGAPKRQKLRSERGTRTWRDERSRTSTAHRQGACSTGLGRRFNSPSGV